MSRSLSLFPTTALLAAALLAGCAAPRMDAQWSNPQSKGTNLSGQTVLVACQARELAVQAVCEEQFARQLAARGARPLQFTAIEAGAAPTRESVEAAARKAAAGYVWRTTLSTSVPAVSTGPTIGIGVGGGGYRGGAAGGVSFPIGGATVSEAYAADSALHETATGRLLWSGRASSPTGGNATMQLGDLARVSVEALQADGLLQPASGPT